MPTSNTDTRREFVGDGVDNSPLALATFPMRRKEDVEFLYITDATGVEVIKVVGTDYTVSIDPDSQGGFITLVTTAPAVGETAIVRRSSDMKHIENYQTHDGFLADVMDGDLDENTLQHLTLQEQSDRSIKVAKGHGNANLPLTALNMIGKGGYGVFVNAGATDFELALGTIGAGSVPLTAIDTTGASDDDVMYYDLATDAVLWGALSNIDLTSQVTGLLPDGNTADDLTIEGGLIDNTPIGLTTANSGSFTTGLFTPGAAGGIIIHTVDGTNSKISFSSTTASEGGAIAWNYTNGLLAINTNKIGASLLLRADANALNLTLSGASGSELATFVKDVTLGGVIIAGSGTNQITTSAGLIAHAKIDPAIAGSGITNTAGVLSVALGAGDVVGPGASVTTDTVWVADGTDGVTLKETAVVATVAGAVSGITTLGTSGLATLASATVTGTLGVGGTLTDGTLHVLTATAGTIAADAAADDLVVENSAAGGITILTPDASNSKILFGSPSDADGAGVQWNYDASAMAVGSLKVGASTLLQGDNGITNLTLSGAAASELATFAGDATLTAGDLLLTAGNATLTNGTLKVTAGKVIMPTPITLASGTSVAITSTYHNLTGTTQIDNMTGGVEGQMLYLTDQTAIILGYNKSGDGKIFSKSKADFTLAAFTGITFICKGTSPNTIWYEV